MRKIILGIEASCDETAAAVLQQKNGRIQILSNVIASSSALQAKYGGIIPEQAAREQIKAIIPVIETAINDSGLTINKIAAIAVTQGPGLIGSLLVGVETAKVLAKIWDKPLIPINHLVGHFYANFIEVPKSKFQVPKFPCVGLLVSGGHTDLVLFKNHNQYEYLGGTRDDAAGECFDKCARLLGLPYPGGPVIAAEAAKLKVKSEKLKIKLPRPLINEETFDFSFSGLKTAAAREVDKLKKNKLWNNKIIAQLSFEIQAAIVEVLVTKTVRAIQKYNVEHIMVAGGVAANQELIHKLKVKSEKLKVKLHVPPPELCTDNGAMIAAAAFFEKETADPLTLQANPNLSLDV